MTTAINGASKEETEKMRNTRGIMAELRKVYNNLGHPSQEAFTSILREEGATERFLALAP